MDRMAFSTSTVFLIFLTIILSVNALANPPLGCKNPVKYCDYHKDYFRRKPTFRYSSTIRDISYHGTYVDFTIVSDVTGSPFVTYPVTEFKYRLVMCGCVPISRPADRQIIYTKPTGIYIAESPTIGLMQRVNRNFNNLLYTGSADFIYNPTVLSRVAAGETKELPFGDYSMLKEDPSLTLSLIGTYGVGGYVAANTTKSYLVIGEVSERTPLGRAEYLKLLALVFNRVGRTEGIFRDIRRKYDRVKAIAASSTSSPSVFFNYPFPPTWTQPGGLQYTSAIITDANARYKYAGDGMLLGRSLTFSEIVGNFSKTDYLVNSAFFPYSNNATISEFISSGDASFTATVNMLRAVRRRRVYSFARRISGNKLAADYFSSAIVNPDLLLADYVKMFHPALKLKHKYVYMYRYKRDV